MGRWKTPLEKKCEAAGLIILRGLKKNPRAAWEVEDALRQPLSLETARTAALVMIQALAQTINDLSASRREFRKEVLEAWDEIMDPRGGKRFRPIVPLASRLLRALPMRTAKAALEEMARTAAAAPPEAAEAGDILQDLVHHRKTLSVYHTRPEAAALMANLAIGDRDTGWSNPDTVREYRMADYSCGAGELLAAAYRRVRELHRQAGGSPGEVHAAVMENAITAVDILPASVAIAAARLDALEPGPADAGGATRAIALRYGPINGGTRSARMRRKVNRPTGLGSLDILDSMQFIRQDLRPIGRGEAARRELKFAKWSQDLVIMNPPFTGRPDHRVMDQNVPNPELHIPPTGDLEIQRMSGRMRRIQETIQAHTGNGYSLYFAHLAHKMVKRGGTIALLLPMSALTAGGGSGETFGSRRPDQGWPAFRRKLTAKYTDIRVAGIAAFEEQDSSFSHDTHIAEVMLIARRTRPGEKPSGTGCFINLKRRPRNEEQAARLAEAIEETIRELEEEPTGAVRELTLDGRSQGTVVRDILPKDDIWTLARVLDPGLMMAVDDLKKGKLHTGDAGKPVQLPITPLGDIARTGPSGNEVDRLLAPANV